MSARALHQGRGLVAAWVVASNLAARDVTRVIVAKTLHDISRRFR